MQGEANWAVTAGSTGVYFVLGPGNRAPAPPDVDIRAVLPNGSEATWVLQPASEDEDVGGYVFDPPLPDGSVVYMNGTALLTVGPPKQ